MRHHYVPAFYLGRSLTRRALPDTSHTCGWSTSTLGKRGNSQPDNTAALSDYYAVGDGDSRYDVERYLSEVESNTAPVVAKILGDAETIEADDKRVLSHFAALQIVRVPQFETASKSSSRRLVKWPAR